MYQNESKLCMFLIKEPFAFTRQSRQSSHGRRHSSGDHSTERRVSSGTMKHLQDQLRQEMEEHIRGIVPQKHVSCLIEGNVTSLCVSYPQRVKAMWRMSRRG